MRQSDVEKLLKYVSHMVDIDDVNNPLQVSREISKGDTEVDEAMEKIYTSQKGKAFCPVCDNLKLKDELRDEYYCPVHD